VLKILQLNVTWVPEAHVLPASKPRVATANQLTLRKVKERGAKYRSSFACEATHQPASRLRSSSISGAWSRPSCASTPDALTNWDLDHITDVRRCTSFDFKLDAAAFASTPASTL